MSSHELIFLGVASFGVSIFSSIAGGGGGFVMTPLLILFGLNPAEAVASGKFLGISISLGNLQVMRKHKTHSWRSALPLVVIATLVGLIVPQFITRLDGDLYQKIIGLFILAMVPVVHYTKTGVKRYAKSVRHTKIGYVLVTVAFFLVGIFSSGLGILVSLVISRLFGLKMIEANVNKRLAQLALNGVIFIGLLGSGLIVWPVALVGGAANYAGGRIGAHISVKKGNKFVISTLKVMMVLAAIAMLLK